MRLPSATPSEASSSCHSLSDIQLTNVGIDAGIHRKIERMREAGMGEGTEKRGTNAESIGATARSYFPISRRQGAGLSPAGRRRVEGWRTAAITDIAPSRRRMRDIAARAHSRTVIPIFRIGRERAHN